MASLRRTVKCFPYRYYSKPETSDEDDEGDIKEENDKDSHLSNQ